jgi:hypothetical protein
VTRLHDFSSVYAASAVNGLRRLRYLNVMYPCFTPRYATLHSNPITDIMIIKDIIIITPFYKASSLY